MDDNIFYSIWKHRNNNICRNSITDAEEVLSMAQICELA